jgi:hypothetical protein
MRYTGLRSDYHEFLCDICGRHVLIHSSPSSAKEGEQTFVVLKRGDFWASHSGGIGGLVINGVEVSQDQDELSDEWKEWLADILDDVD